MSHAGSDAEHPDEDDLRPLRGPGRRFFMRFVVLVCVAALIVPSVLSMWSHFAFLAARACAAAVTYSDPRATGSDARFELGGPGAVGWECYAITDGDSRHVVSLGLFPSETELPVRREPAPDRA